MSTMRAADNTYAETSRCREGGMHAGESVEDTHGDHVAHICTKCLDRVKPIITPRMVPGWPRRTVFFVNFE